MDLVESARLFATAAHAAVGQKRKYTGEDYIVHPTNVAAILEGFLDSPSPQILAAAYLHDVVEDTEVTVKTIEKEFGGRVAYLVSGVTDVSRPEDGNRAARKAIDRAHIAMGDAEVQTLKLADLIDNTQSIVRHDPDFAKVYLEEKELLLNVMHVADPGLMAHARKFPEGTMAHARKLLEENRSDNNVPVAQQDRATAF